MLELLPRVPLFQLFRRVGRPEMLPINLTLVPSTRCNSRCLTCNIWKTHTDELELSEWEQVFRSLGKSPYWVTISGGEPFLYPHLITFVTRLYELCRPAIINIPHNSLLDHVISRRVAEIAERCSDSQIVVNLSLDGVGEDHDRIRGVPGNFARFEKTYRSLRELDYPNLVIGIHTVISKYNARDIDDLVEYALALQPDSYISEIAEQRVELGTTGLDIAPSIDEYRQIVERLISRLSRHTFNNLSQITWSFRKEYYRLVTRILTEQTQVIPCYAGWASAQIHSNGDVWPCCVRGDAIMNLRDVNYDFRQVWFSPQADRIRQSIREKECYCPLANAGYTNMLHDYKSIARVGWGVLKSRLPGRRG